MLRWYYLATPAFWLLDLLWGVRVRVAFLDDVPVVRNLYYALCCGIGVVATITPRYTPRLAFFESASNIGLLILSVGLWYARVLDWASSPSVAVQVPSLWQLVNFVLVAAAGTISYGLRGASLAAVSTDVQ